MSARPKRQVLKNPSSSPRESYREEFDEDDDSIGLDEELEDEALSGEENLISDDDEPLDDGELEADDVYDDGEGGFDEDEDEDEDEFEEPGSRSKVKVNAKTPVKNVAKKANDVFKAPTANSVSVKARSSSSLLVSMNFANKKKLSKILTKESKPKAAAKGNSRTRNIKVSYTEPNEDDFGSDVDAVEEEKPLVKKGSTTRSSNKNSYANRGRGRNTTTTSDDDDDDDDDEDEDDEDLDDEDIEMDDNEESDVDLSKLSERQRSKILGVSEEPEEMTPEFYQGKKLPKSVLALMENSSKKKALTEEQIQLKKAEAARKRKTFNMRKLEAEKKETLKKLLHRKIEKVDAKKQEEENERRKQNQLKRKELITHKALFSWVSKTETVDGAKRDVSFYSMQ